MSDSDDRWQIQALINEYAYTLDSGDFEGNAALFADADRFGVDPLTGEEFGRTRGAVEFEKQQRATMHTYENGSPRTKHVITNVTIDVDEGGRTATARAYLTVFQGVPSRLPLQAIFSGRYENRFAKRERDGAWYFTEQKVHSDFVGDIGLHTTIAAPTTGDPRSNLE
jgi:3-phenylpropionate/cinnamic acid dioxygenase small subunit